MDTGKEGVKSQVLAVLNRHVIRRESYYKNIFNVSERLPLALCDSCKALTNLISVG